MSRSASHFQVKTEVNVGIFTHLRLSWLESPENYIKGIKSLSQIENKAWSGTVGKFLQPVKLNRSVFFFQSIHLSILWYTPGRWDMFDMLSWKYWEIYYHIHTVTKYKKYRTSAIQRVPQLWKYDLPFFSVVNLRSR